MLRNELSIELPVDIAIRREHSIVNRVQADLYPNEEDDENRQGICITQIPANKNGAEKGRRINY